MNGDLQSLLWSHLLIRDVKFAGLSLRAWFSSICLTHIGSRPYYVRLVLFVATPYTQIILDELFLNFLGNHLLDPEVSLCRPCPLDALHLTAMTPYRAFSNGCDNG